MTTENKDVLYQEHAIVTVYLPPMKPAALFEMHAAIKTAVGGLEQVKIDFRVLSQKGFNEPNGGLGNKSGNPNEPT